MVISKKYKYVFVELPFTASTAISTELCENYDGIKILHKHSRYNEFLSSASNEEKEYYVFSTIRHPMDAMVSVFFKLKYNHKGKFTNPKEWKINGGNVFNKDLKKFRFIQKHDLDFSAYFKKYFFYPYDNWSRLDHKNFNYVIRFEHLQEDFSKVLQNIGVEQIRPLPQINKTRNKEKNYIDYFTPEIRQRAINVFGPFMKKWDYAFTNDWSNIKISPLWEMEFNILGFVRSIYWKFFMRSTSAQRKERIQNYNSFDSISSAPKNDRGQL